MRSRDSKPKNTSQHDIYYIWGVSDAAIQYKSLSQIILPNQISFVESFKIHNTIDSKPIVMYVKKIHFTRISTEQL